nr:probable flavin-containing monooxygenase 1 [Ipomoea batatas]GMC50069.1 probable flavin-containing monooxygenase 1 [Ipomoea batatas]GMC53943.1 probable flavin-containing monooxygenase 1 [Ipomoea batatas]
MAAVHCKIGIIGAGISGLAAAKQLSEHEPVVFEATDCIGGVWKHCSFRSTKLQTPRCDYEFSDFPWTQRDNSSFPTYQEILDYLHSYATHFDILKFVKFNSKVVETRFIGHRESTGSGGDNGEYGSLLPGHPVWEVAVQTNQSETLQLDKEESTHLLKGKKVVVFGYKKSAIDLAVECAEANQVLVFWLLLHALSMIADLSMCLNKGTDGQACTMVIRTLHWTVPHYSVWGLPFYLFFSTRSSQFLYERPKQGLARTLLCHLLSPLRWGVSKTIESYLSWKLPLDKYGLRPDHPFVEDYASCQMAILPENFFQEAERGKIQFKKASSKWWFWEGGVEFEDGTRLEADVVILATGFDGKKKLKTIIPDPFRSLLEFPASGLMPLYKGTINPLIPNMAFVGFIESVSNLHTAEIRCKWLSRLVDGHFKLPRVEKMVEQTQEEVEIMKRSTRFYKRSCISTFSINHSDEICEEMGWESWRKKTWLSEAFSPYNSQDYTEEK